MGWLKDFRERQNKKSHENYKIALERLRKRAKLEAHVQKVYEQREKSRLTIAKYRGSASKARGNTGGSVGWRGTANRLANNSQALFGGAGSGGGGFFAAMQGSPRKQARGSTGSSFFDAMMNKKTSVGAVRHKRKRAGSGRGIVIR